ncbi:C40 family peptidase [Arthrobacter sp. 7Tela_A1]|uniref:C40 family peptidase n=1 Tax=Arthrobacter sp. 7Tela_A1 TaxID=3093745 RepID=UPI003BB57EE8
MSMTDAIGRIQEIRSTIDALSGTSAASAASAPAARSASLGGDTGFAAALSAVSGSAAAPGGASNEALMASVEKYVGLPYVWGGNDPAVGLDCSSFVQNVFKDLGHSLPRVTWDQMNSGTKVDSLAQAQAGDLLFTHDGGHVSIYLGDGKVVDAPQPGKTIQVRDAWETDANITTIRRILPTETAAVQGASAPSTAAAITDMVASARAMQASLMGAAQ